MLQTCRHCGREFEHKRKLFRCLSCLRDYHAEWRIKRGQTRARRPSPSGRTHIREYATWQNIKRRCLTPGSSHYANYGGRGITVCQEWQVSFEAFYRDMGAKPSPNHSIDRIDNNGNYEPSNCRWATRLEQMNNTRANRRVEIDGRTQTLMEWAREMDIGDRAVLRLAQGLPIRRRQHCLNGHLFSAANTRIGRKGDRQCRTCDSARKRARYHQELITQEAK